MVTPPRLTPAQADLLDEVKTADPLYVRRNGRYGRTISALLSKGYVRISQHDYSPLGMDAYVAIVACPGHDSTDGPHHNQECCMYADEVEA